MSVKFCENCRKVMESSIEMVDSSDPSLPGAGPRRSTVSYGVKFTCPICSSFVVGQDEDVKLFSEVIDNGLAPQSQVDVAAGKGVLYLSIANDPTRYKVAQTCECGVPFMTMYVTGHDEKVVMVCTCGAYTKYNPDNKDLRV